MHCDFYFPLSSGECTASRRSILDFGDEQAEIFLSEIGLLCGRVTRKYQICDGYVDRLIHLMKTRNKTVCCGIPTHLAAHTPGRPVPHGESRVNRAMMLKIQSCTGAVIPVGTGMKHGVYCNAWKGYLSVYK